MLEAYEGREEFIPWDKLPPDVNDFPSDLQKAISAFNKMSDNVVDGIGYMGKNYDLIEQLIETENVNNKSLFLEALLRLDQHLIEKSRKDMEEARKQAKRGKS